jgi:hypothetical protein
MAWPGKLRGGSSARGQLVRPDHRAGPFRQGLLRGRRQPGSRSVQRSGRFGAAPQQGLDVPPQLGLFRAGRFQIGPALLGRSDFQRGVEEGFFFGEILAHGGISRPPGLLSTRKGDGGDRGNKRSRRVRETITAR